MKKILLSTVALIAITGSASAADLPSIKSAPAPAPLMKWTGFYAGLNIGGGFGSASTYSSGIPYDVWYQANNQSHLAAPFFLPASIPWNSTINGLAYVNTGGKSLAQSGVIGGLQIGYNYQVHDKVVVGIETDFQGAGINGNNGSLKNAQDSLGTVFRPGWASIRDTALFRNVSSSINWLGTLRARVGYLVTPSFLAYGTGGFTYAGVSTSVQSYGISAFQGKDPDTFAIDQIGYTLATGNGSSSNIALGWNAGGGFEWMFMSNWSAKAEAFYYSLGGANTASGTIGGPNLNYRSLRFPGWGLATNTNVSYNGVVARLGVNYHFNLANVAPVVAKF